MSLLKKLLLVVCLSSPGALCFGAGSLFEVISVGTTTAATGTTTTHNSEWAAAAKDGYVEGFYIFNAGTSTTILYMRFDGATATTSNGMRIIDKQGFKLRNIDDITRVNFICDNGIGSVTATYSRSRRDNN